MRKIYHVTTVNSGVQVPGSKDYFQLPDEAALYHMCERANADIAANPQAIHVSLEHEDVIDGKPITKKAIGGYVTGCFIAEGKDGGKRLMANFALHVSDEHGPGEPMGDMLLAMLRYVQELLCSRHGTLTCGSAGTEPRRRLLWSGSSARTRPWDRRVLSFNSPAFLCARSIVSPGATCRPSILRRWRWRVRRWAARASAQAM